jgi:hypothetical protein
MTETNCGRGDVGEKGDPGTCENFRPNPEILLASMITAGSEKEILARAIISFLEENKNARIFAYWEEAGLPRKVEIKTAKIVKRNNKFVHCVGIDVDGAEYWIGDCEITGTCENENNEIFLAGQTFAPTNLKQLTNQ